MTSPNLKNCSNSLQLQKTGANIHFTLICQGGLYIKKSDWNALMGGGQVESCNVKFSEKCLCSHHNITHLIKQISLNHEKYPKFQFEKKYIYKQGKAESWFQYDQGEANRNEALYSQLPGSAMSGLIPTLGPRPLLMRNQHFYCTLICIFQELSSYRNVYVLQSLTNVFFCFISFFLCAVKKCLARSQAATDVTFFLYIHNPKSGSHNPVRM